jgi:hypothetical protein
MRGGPTAMTWATTPHSPPHPPTRHGNSHHTQHTEGGEGRRACNGFLSLCFHGVRWGGRSGRC